jgi:hypothetical protein
MSFTKGNTDSLQQIRHNTSDTLPVNYHGHGVSTTMPATLDLPPSLRAAAENVRFGTLYQGAMPEDARRRTLYLDDASGQAAANTPFSFHNRTLQSALTEPKFNFEVFSDDLMLEEAASPHRADSGRGSLDKSTDFVGFTDATNFHFDRNEYNRPLQGTSFVRSKGVENEDPSRYQPSPLQYHLIRTKSRIDCKENVTDVPLSPCSSGLTTQSSSRYVPPSASEILVGLLVYSNESRTLSCHLCIDKQYTGVWAHRNLMRHMESAHAPSSSTDGGKHLPCGDVKCDRTFRREDARLVHERRSHPELNRPPPTKRKRSGEL